MRRALIVLVVGALGCGGVANADLANASDASMGDDSVPASDGGFFDDVTFGNDSASPGTRYLLCPPTAPPPGSACDDRDNLCEYGSSNNVLCNTLYRCVRSQWRITQDTASCPVVQSCPSDLDAGTCMSMQTRCEYPDAGRDCVCTTCGAGPPPPPPGPVPRWWCFDPGAGCPLVRPNMGTPCSIADGGQCTYSPGACCAGVVLYCVESVWVGGMTGGCP